MSWLTCVAVEKLVVGFLSSTTGPPSGWADLEIVAALGFGGGPAEALVLALPLASGGSCPASRAARVLSWSPCRRRLVQEAAELFADHHTVVAHGPVFQSGRNVVHVVVCAFLARLSRLSTPQFEANSHRTAKKEQHLIASAVSGSLTMF
eukprot:3639245-Amphidinium_carterae.1